MSEFCAGVKILLERMKSNPEDFELLDYDVSAIRGIQGRFYTVAIAMEKIIFGREDKEHPWKDWYYFTEEERQALIDGFKEMKRAKFDNGIMERMLDEQYIERQREELRKAKHQYYSSPAVPFVDPAQQHTQIQPLHNGGYTTVTTDNTAGLVGSIGLGGIFG